MPKNTSSKKTETINVQERASIRVITSDISLVESLKIPRSYFSASSNASRNHSSKSGPNKQK